MKRLPRGRHHLTREFVVENQRQRVIDAVIESFDKRGYEKTTATQISKHAGVSKSDIYKLFSNKDECFVVAYDDAVERLRDHILSAASKATGGWPMQVCAGLRALLEFLAQDPATANFLLVEGLRVGPHTHERLQEAMGSFVPYLRQGWAARPGGPPPEAVDEAVLGGIVSLLYRRAAAGETDQLEQLFPEIAEFVLSPYLGPSKTRRIISAA